MENSKHPPTPPLCIYMVSCHSNSKHGHINACSCAKQRVPTFSAAMFLWIKCSNKLNRGRFFNSASKACIQDPGPPTSSIWLILHHSGQAVISCVWLSRSSSHYPYETVAHPWPFHHKRETGERQREVVGSEMFVISCCIPLVARQRIAFPSRWMFVRFRDAPLTNTGLLIISVAFK